jgi:integrase
MRWPEGQPSPAADWWRALLVTAAMTGWRIGRLLALRRADVDLEAGYIITRAEHNKGKRDQRIELHPFAVEHLRRIASFSAVVFPWPHGLRLYGEFHRLQEKAGINLARPYGFHDLRRMFASRNADRLTPDQLQQMMQHKAHTTTQRYINMARQAKQVTEKLYVPDVGAKAKQAE